MELKAYATRQGGQWKIRLHAPKWVIEDILRDADLRISSVITVDASDTNYYSKPTSSLLASVTFEESIDKKMEVSDELEVNG